MDCEDRQWWLRACAVCAGFLLLVAGASAQIQRHRFDNLNTGKLGTVRVLLEGAHGYIWVGGNGGLARFDGHRLQPVAANRIHGPIYALVFQGHSRLWIGSAHGLILWNLVEQQPLDIPCKGFVAGVGQLQIVGNDILALSRSGLFRIDGQTLTCRQLPIAGLPAGQPIERFLVDAGHLWLAIRSHGLWRCQPSGTAATPWASALADTRIRWISTATDDGLYVGTHRHGLYRLDKHGNVVEHWWRGTDAPPDHALPTNGVMTVLHASDGRLYVGLWAGGLIEMAADGKVIARSMPLQREPTSLSGRDIGALLQSSTGAIWIGHENGVSVLDPTRNQVPWIGLADKGQAGLSDSVVRALWKHGDKLYAGTAHGGVDQIDLATGTVVEVKKNPSQRDEHSAQSVWGMLGTRDGQLLLATSGGLARLTTQPLQIDTLTATPTLPSDDVMSVAKARDGGYWISAWAGGVMRVDKDGHVIKIWRADDGLDVESMGAVFEDRRGHVLTGNGKGLFMLGKDGRFHRVHVTGAAHAGQIATVLTFKQLSDGTLWMGTDSGKLIRWAPDASKPAWIDTTGLGNLDINAIQPRKQGGLWLATSDGLYVVNGDGVVLQRLGKGTGLEFDNIFALLPDGDDLWVAGDGGVQRLGPKLPVIRRVDKAPVITDVRLFNKPLHPKPSGALTASPSRGGHLHLRYDQELLTLDFAYPGLPQPPGLRFRYRLAGFDQSWVEVTANEAHAVYTRLPPGDYRFQVEAGDAQGWVGHATEMPITVTPPWWMTWWARLLLLLAIVAALVTGYRMRTLKLRKQSLRLEKLIQERTLALSEANLALQKFASTDTLTGLANRRGFQDVADPQWSSLAGRAALFLVDIDHFKAINDEFGHDAGDAVLIEVANRLHSITQAGDLVARWGGEEFLCLLVGEGSREQAQAMRLAVADTKFDTPAGAVHVSITGGHAHIRNNDTFRDTIRRADALLYEGKRCGRDRVVFDSANRSETLDDASV